MSPEHSVPIWNPWQLWLQQYKLCQVRYCHFILVFIILLPFMIAPRAWDLIYHSPSINCSHFPSGKIKSTPLSGGTLVWTSEANKASGEAGCPSSYLGDNGHHISSDSAKQWLTWAGGVLKSGNRSSCSPEYCLLILRLPTAFIALGGTWPWPFAMIAVTLASRLLQSPVSLVLYSDTFPEVVTGQLLLLLRQEPWVILYWPQNFQLLV